MVNVCNGRIFCNIIHIYLFSIEIFKEWLIQALTFCQMTQKQTKMENLIAAMVNDMSPKTRAHLNPPSPSRMACDILPYLLHIIQPNLRPVRHSNSTCVLLSSQNSLNFTLSCSYIPQWDHSLYFLAELTLHCVDNDLPTFHVTGKHTTVQQTGTCGPQRPHWHHAGLQPYLHPGARSERTVLLRPWPVSWFSFVLLSEGCVLNPWITYISICGLIWSTFSF